MPRACGSSGRTAHARLYPDASSLQSPCALSCPTLSARRLLGPELPVAVPVCSGLHRLSRLRQVVPTELPFFLTVSLRGLTALRGRRPQSSVPKASGGGRRSRGQPAPGVLRRSLPPAAHVGRGFQKSRGTARPVLRRSAMISASRAAARLPLLLPRGGPGPAVPGLAQVRVGPEGAGRARRGLGGGGRGSAGGERGWGGSAANFRSARV